MKLVNCEYIYLMLGLLCKEVQDDGGVQAGVEGG